MTRKDFRELADILRESREDIDPIIFSRLSSRFQAFLRARYTSFDTSKFTEYLYTK